MSLKDVARAVIVGGAVAAASVLVAPAANAAPGASNAPSVCRENPDSHFTLGQCVNIVKFLTVSPDEGSSFVAGLCGADINQQIAGVLNEGQCVKTLHKLI